MGGTYPPGHVLGLAVTLEAIPYGLMTELEQKGFVTIPDDLTEVPDFQEGMVLQIQDAYCVKCHLPFGMIRLDPVCAWDEPKTRVHLRGGKKDRARRTRTIPADVEFSTADVPAGRHRRETPALMQASRLEGLA